MGGRVWEWAGADFIGSKNALTNERMRSINHPILKMVGQIG